MKSPQRHRCCVSKNCFGTILQDEDARKNQVDPKPRKIVCRNCTIIVTDMLMQVPHRLETFCHRHDYLYVVLQYVETSQASQCLAHRNVKAAKGRRERRLDDDDTNALCVVDPCCSSILNIVRRKCSTKNDQEEWSVVVASVDHQTEL